MEEASGIEVIRVLKVRKFANNDKKDNFLGVLIMGEFLKEFFPENSYVKVIISKGNFAGEIINPVEITEVMEKARKSFELFDKKRTNKIKKDKSLEEIILHIDSLEIIENIEVIRVLKVRKYSYGGKKNNGLGVTIYGEWFKEFFPENSYVKVIISKGKFVGEIINPMEMTEVVEKARKSFEPFKNRGRKRGRKRIDAIKKDKSLEEIIFQKDAPNYENIDSAAEKIAIASKSPKINLNENHFLQTFKKQLKGIQSFLDGNNIPLSPEKLCFWVWLCYTFELYYEGVQIFRKIEKDKLPPDFYNIIKKIAEACELNL